MMIRLQSFGPECRALVIGSSGALGQAFCELLRGGPGCAALTELGRRTRPCLDLERPESIGAAAAAVADRGPFHLILLAIGRAA